MNKNVSSLVVIVIVLLISNNKEQDLNLMCFDRFSEILDF